MIARYEIEILHRLQDLVAGWPIEEVMVALSKAGNGGMLWIVLAVVLVLFARTRAASMAMGAALLLVLLTCNLGLKPWVARPRPCMIEEALATVIACPSDFSFPSGHSSAGFAAATTLAFFFPRAGAAALVLAAIIAFSRLYLFVHFPSDVLAGIVLGCTCGTAGWLMVSAALRLRQRTPARVRAHRPGATVMPPGQKPHAPDA